MIVGTAEVLVLPVVRGFEGELKKQTAAGMTSFRKDAEIAGVDAGASMRAGVGRETGKLGKDLEEHGHKAGVGLSRGMASGLGGLGTIVTVATVGALAGVAHLAEGMQKADAGIAAASGTSVASAKRIGDAFLGTAGKSTFTGEQMAKAFAPVAGQLKAAEGRALSTSDAMKVMSAATDLAEGKQIDLGVATSATAGILQAFHLSVGDAANVTDVLFQASSATGQGVDTLASQLTKVRSKLGDTAGSVGELAGLLVDMKDQGISGRAGLAGLSTGLTSIMTPSKTAKAALHELGVTTFDAQGRFVGMGSIIEQLHPKFAGLTQQQQRQAAATLFGKSAATQMLAVINAGPAAYDKATQSVNQHGAAQQAAAKQSHTLHGQEATLSAEVTDLATKFGQVAIPVLTAFAGALLHATTFVTQHKAVLIALGVVVGGALSAAIGVFTVNKMAAFANSFVTASGHVRDFAGNVESAVSRVIKQFTLQTDAAETSATRISTATKETSAAVETEATSVGTSSTAVDASFAGTATSAEVASAKVGTAVTAETAEVATADTAIEADNAAAGASFTALLGPIAAAGAAVALFGNSLGSQTRTTITGHANEIKALEGAGLTKAQAERWLAANGGSNMMDTPGGGIGPYRPPRGSTNGVPVPPSGSNWQRIASALEGQGFSKVAVAGILGNFAQENGGQTLSGISTRNTAGGLGIAQWTGSRKASEADYAAIHHEAPTSLAAEVGYLVQELRTTEHGAFRAIQGAKTPEQAARLFEQIYERAGIPNNPVREREARRAYALLNGGGSSGGLTAGQKAGVLGILNGTGGASSHSGAAGATGAASSPAARQLLYANPLGRAHGVVRGRTDMGVDYSARPGSAVDALGAGKIVDIISNWYKGQPLIEEQLTQGKLKGQYVYYAEQLKAAVRQGQTVKAGERIGTVAQSGTGLELGLGAPHGLTLAQATTGYHEGEVTAAGRQYARLVGQIGGGVYSSGSGGVSVPKAPTIGMALTGHGLTGGQATDLNAGMAAMTKLVAAIHSGSMTKLQAQLTTANDKALTQIERDLNNDHNSALSKLSKDLVAIHKTAMRDLIKEEAQAAKAAAEKAEIAALGYQARIGADHAKQVADQITDSTKVYLDTQAQTGLTGAALVAAQAQTAYDTVVQNTNQAVDAAQTAVDQAANGTQLAQAQAAANLAAAQANQQIDEALAQATLDKANAAANAAAANATTTTAPTSSSTPPPAPVVNNFEINGAGMTAGQLAGEITWTLRTGALPVAAPVPAPAG